MPTPQQLVIATLIALLARGGVARAEEKSPASLAVALARLRGEVETLSARLEQKKNDHRVRMRSLATQKTDLELSLGREKLRLGQLAKRKAAQRQRVAKENARHRELAPAVERLAAVLEQAIARSLPFRRGDRRREISKLKARAKAGTLAADVALAQLWERVEDELRLGRESGLYQQVIKLEGHAQLVEVARVGMVMLFFRTRDGRYGLTERRGDGFRYVVISEPKLAQLVAQLFDAFKKQIRSGFFSLPGAAAPALPATGGAR